MEQNKKQKFNDLVKRKIQDKDEDLQKIPDIWGENHIPLTDTYTLIALDNNTKVGLEFDQHYELSDEIKRKISEIFYNEEWVL